ncbi:MAG: anti-sigma factor family protein [Blastocatellia bacterium]
MNCQEINGQFGALLDQALEPAQATAVERHLKHCAECQAELEHLRALKTALQNVEPPMASASLDERVMAAFRLRHRQARDVSEVSGWRAWFFNSFMIPKPALALMGVLLVGASALAYRAGEIMGTRLPAIEPPAQADYRIVPPVESVRVIYARAPGGCARPDSRQTAPPQTGSAKAADARLAALQLETQTSASEAGIDYTTSAALESFEPVKDPSVRIIKGGNQ